MPNESRDAGYYYCLLHPRHGRDAGRSSAGVCALSACVERAKASTLHRMRRFTSVLHRLSDDAQNVKCFSRIWSVCGITWRCNPPMGVCSVQSK